MNEGYVHSKFMKICVQNNKTETYVYIIDNSIILCNVQQLF